MEGVKTERDAKTVKNKQFKSEEPVWNHNYAPGSYATKTEEEEEEKFFCAVCDHSSYSIEVYILYAHIFIRRGL